MVAGAVAGGGSAGATVVIRRLGLAWAGMALASLMLAFAWRAFALPPVGPAGFGIAFYQRVLGHLDGRACPSWPVCSLYARQAVARHGLLLGSWLALDRLIHENDDLRRGPWMRDADGRRLYDPLARNDFWLRER